jgi:hypothetical protein
MVKQFKTVIKTRSGYDRFEFFLACNKEEVKCAVEETLKRGEKIRYIREVDT